MRSRYQGSHKILPHPLKSGFHQKSNIRKQESCPAPDVAAAVLATATVYVTSREHLIDSEMVWTEELWLMTNLLR